MSNDLKIIGKTLDEVADVLGDEYSFRVVSRDGVPCVTVRDLRDNRVNLTLVERKVVSYTIG